jgi:hypothetical protein
MYRDLLKSLIKLPTFSRLSFTNRILLLVSFCILGVGIILGSIFCNFITSLGFFRVTTMLPEQVMIDIPQLLKSSLWTAESDVKGNAEGLWDIQISDRAGRERVTWNIQNHSAMIDQKVFGFSDASHAKEQYRVFETFEFADSFPGNPPKGPTFTYKNWERGPNLKIQADRYRIACMDMYEASNPAKTIQTECKAIFLYNNYLIYINMWPMRNYSTYLSSDDLATIFKAVDANKASYQ